MLYIVPSIVDARHVIQSLYTNESSLVILLFIVLNSILLFKHKETNYIIIKKTANASRSLRWILVRNLLLKNTKEVKVRKKRIIYESSYSIYILARVKQRGELLYLS